MTRVKRLAIPFVALLAFSALGAAGCDNVVIGTPSVQTVPLRFSGTPADATVTIDDQRVGSLTLVATRGVRVFPGKHHVSIEAVGYLPDDRVVDAKEGIVRIEAHLAPIPD